MRFRLVKATMMLLAAVTMLAGCVFKSDPVVLPEMSTAEEQYQVAVEAYTRAKGTLQTSDKHERVVMEAEAAFQKVVDRFPRDPNVTPRASLYLGRCAFELRGDPGLAAKRYRGTLREYPDNEEVQSNGLYELGRALDDDKKYSEAKEAYQQFMDRFKDTKNPATQRLLADARRRFRQVRTAE